MLEVDIPDDQIDVCMAQASGRYLWYAVLASKAKLHRETIEAQIALEKRGEWSESKVTETLITELVRYDERWQKARESELLFNDLAKAFEKRMDLVQSVGSWLRSERGKEIRTLKQGVARAVQHKRKGV
jgi:hypothetical protein